MSTDFSTINSCATCYGNLVFGGANVTNMGSVGRYTINPSSGLLVFSGSTSIGGATVVNYCERCCCGDDYLLVGTDNGLYSLNPNMLNIVASNISMPNNTWINTCWCCDMDGDYCIAVNSSHETYVFRQAGASLNQVLQLPS